MFTPLLVDSALSDWYVMFVGCIDATNSTYAGDGSKRKFLELIWAGTLGINGLNVNGLT